jgi:U5 small nuclear ribonucleoprotein component
MDLYDEFGNYVGPELEEDDNSDIESDFGEANEQPEDGGDGMDVIEYADGTDPAIDENRIVLHEDKKYYPDASEVYPGVRTVTLDEDAQDLATPIIKPIKQKNFSVLQKEPPSMTYSPEFLASLMHTPNLIRNIAVIGHLHHGKTLFIDTLVQATQTDVWDPHKDVRYTDTRRDEQDRELSIKSTAVSLVLENIKSKSFLLNILDCPGHVNFSDEATAAIRAADGAVIVVDAVEGVMLNTERMIKHALDSDLPLCLVINKMDRLVLELKLPPQDAYYKIMHTLEEVNNIIAAHSSVRASHGDGIEETPQRLSPEKGNVCFSSGHHGWSFTLESFAQLYCDRHPEAPMDPVDFAKRLWGDWYFNEGTNAISRKKTSGAGSTAVRTFVQFILEPLYKIYAFGIGETAEDVTYLLKQLGVKLKSKELHLDPKPLLKLILSRFFGLPKGFVSMIVTHVPSPIEGAAVKVANDYSGYQTSHLAVAMKACKPSGPLMMNVVKLYNNPEGNKFLSFARIFSGTIRKGQRVKVLGEAYTQDDDEDMAIVEVTGISVSVGRFFLEVDSAVAGNWVLLEGVDAPIKKTATITDLEVEDVYIFKPLRFNTIACVKLAVEPFNPSELPKMVEALRRINKSYPLCTTKVEESGEHVILGTGELYLDCVMHDLRHLYSDMEVKVADPVVSFCETVVESSSINCFSETPNKRNKLTMLAEPLDSGLSDDIESHVVDIDWDKKTIGEFFKKKYDWDLLSARSIWAFGPDNDGPNMLLDNTIPSEVDRSLLNTVRESVVQGFKWGCREGPLCDEPIRNVKFKILDAQIALEPIHRGGGQVIPTSRRTAYSSFLMATPRMMEPVFLCEIQAPADCVQAVYPVLARRRGHVVQDAPKPGTPFYTVKAFLPIMDSFGFEADLRSYTLGQAFCQQVFDHWSVVPGDPLDRNVILHPLEPSPPLALAKDFMVKTRRRKGLSEEVSINKYFDEAMIMELAKHEAEVGAIF